MTVFSLVIIKIIHASPLAHISKFRLAVPPSQSGAVWVCIATYERNKRNRHVLYHRNQHKNIFNKVLANYGLYLNLCYNFETTRYGTQIVTWSDA